MQQNLLQRKRRRTKQVRPTNGLIFYLFFFFFTQNGYTRAAKSKGLIVNTAPPLADRHSIAFLRPQCRGLGPLPAKTEAVCAC